MRVGLAGFGTAGQEVARRLVAGAIDGLRLSAVTARDLAKARDNAAKLQPAPPVVPLEELRMAPAFSPRSRSAARSSTGSPWRPARCRCTVGSITATGCRIASGWCGSRSQA
jgi:hypothetical protein